MSSRRIALVALPDAMSLDVVGPLEVFHSAARLARMGDQSAPPCYEVEILAPEAGPLRTESGVQLVADRAWRDATDPIDTLLVAGGAGPDLWRAAREPGLLAWIRERAPGPRAGDSRS